MADNNNEVEVMGISDILTKQMKVSGSAQSERKMSEIIADMFADYYDPDDIREKTELNDNEIAMFTKLLVYKYMLKLYFNHDAPYIAKLIDEKYHLSISKERKGRNEVSKTMQAFSAMKVKEEEEQNTLKRLFSEKVGK